MSSEFLAKNFVVHLSTTKILPPEKYLLYGIRYTVYGLYKGGRDTGMLHV